MLKDTQRQQREQFFVDGKAEFSALRTGIYRELREEFREQWRDYFEAQKNGGDAEAFKTQKEQLIAAQRGELAARRDETCAGLREMRDSQYRALLDQQRDIRHELAGWREHGFDEARLAQLLNGKAPSPIADEFRSAAVEASRSTGAAMDPEMEGAETASPAAGEQITLVPASGAYMAERAAFEIGGPFVNFFGGILLNFGETSAPPRVRNDDAYQQAADEAGKRQQHEQQQVADEGWRERERTRVWD